MSELKALQSNELDAMALLARCVIVLNNALPSGAAEARQEASDLMAQARAAYDALPGPLPVVEFHQHDWIPGFAAFAPHATTPSPNSRAFCVINLGSALAAIQTGDMPKEDLPYHLAESMMHEVVHVVEQWAGVEFSEVRVEALLERYRQTYQQ